LFGKKAAKYFRDGGLRMNYLFQSQPAVELYNVCKDYEVGGDALQALTNVSFEAKPGRLSALVGPSGCGKTTALTIMAGLIRPSSGRVSLFDRNLGDYSDVELQRLRASRIGFVFQNFNLLNCLTAFQNVSFPLQFANRANAECRLLATRALEKVGILHLAQRNPQNLSHGEKQRVAVARAIANEPDLIIADEPTASLELSQGEGIIHLLSEYARMENKAVVIASHDLRITKLADDILTLANGCHARKDLKLRYSQPFNMK
jgi:putative ABC transport system ATP-binding protein